MRDKKTQGSFKIERRKEEEDEMWRRIFMIGIFILRREQFKMHYSQFCFCPLGLKKFYYDLFIPLSLDLFIFFETRESYNLYLYLNEYINFIFDSLHGTYICSMGQQHIHNRYVARGKCERVRWLELYNFYYPRRQIFTIETIWGIL